MARFFQILFVDDSAAHTAIFRETVGAFRHDRIVAAFASNGAEALAYLLRHPPFEVSRRPDLILLDYDLPMITGHEVLEAVRDYDELQAVPVVVLTRNASLAEVAACYRDGANSVVERPVSLESLAGVYREIIRYWTHTCVPLPVLYEEP